MEEKYKKWFRSHVNLEERIDGLECEREDLMKGLWDMLDGDVPPPPPPIINCSVIII